MFDILPIGPNVNELRALENNPIEGDPDDYEQRIEEKAKYWFAEFRKKIEDRSGNRGFQGSIFIAYFHKRKNYEHL